MLKIHFALVLLISVIFSACKITQPLDQNSEVSGIGGIEIQKERMFTVSEMDVLQRICSRLKSKRDYFNSLDDMKERFKFSLQNKNCDGGIYASLDIGVAISNTSSTDLEYVVDRSDYFRDVITDQSHGIKNLCDQMNSTNLSNRYVQDKITFTYNLYISNGYDYLEMSRSTKDTNGNLNLKTSEKISFITQSYQGATKFYGVEKERTRYTVCGPNRVSSIQETWQGPLTAF